MSAVSMDLTLHPMPCCRMSWRCHQVKVACALIAVMAVHCSSDASESRHTSRPSDAERVARHELVAAVFEWIRCTNAGDFDAQMAFYPERMNAFYLWRNTPRAAVLAEKRKVFAKAATIEIKADAPQIIVDPEGTMARTYFRKTYTIDGTRRRSGEVLQELRWEKQSDGWKIVSERDLRVIR
jgi:ketosteroid isomerase-like protein